MFHCVMVLSSIIGSAAISSLEWNNIEQRTHQGRTCFLDGQRSTTKWGLHDHTQNWVNGDIWVFSLHILTFRRCRSPYSVKTNRLPTYLEVGIFSRSIIISKSFSFWVVVCIQKVIGLGLSCNKHLWSHPEDTLLFRDFAIQEMRYKLTHLYSFA